MSKPSWRFLLLVSVLVAAATGSWARGQTAILTVASTARTVISTSRTALLGTIDLSVSTGTTGAGTVVVQYQGVVLTSDVASGISVTGFGGLAAAVVTGVDQGAGTVTISVPAGAVAGDIMILDGVRVDIAAAGLSQVSASVSADIGSGFTFLAGGTQVNLIDATLAGMEVEDGSDVVLSILGPPPVGTPQPVVVVKETFKRAFSDALGVLGQTVATRVQILAVGIPAGVEITFPMVVTDANTAATLTAVAVGGDPLELTLPTSTGGNTITYEFASTAGSPNRIERFSIALTLDVQTSFPDAEVVSFQATLFPHDAPSIPRFARLLLPAEEDLPLPEFEDIIPTLQGVDQFMGLALTSDSDILYTVTLEAFDPSGQLLSGPDIVNPATLTLAPGAQTSGLLSDFFGTGIQGGELGSVVVRGRRKRPVSLFFLGDEAGTQLDGATGRQTPVKSFVYPSLGEGEGAFTVIHLFNPSLDTEADVTLTLEDLPGNALDSELIHLAPRGSFSGELSALFEVPPAPFQGRVRGLASSEVVAFESFGNSQAVNALSGQPVGLFQEISRVPHFVAGGGFDTEVSLINSDLLKAATVEVSLRDGDGSPLAEAPDPREVALLRGEKAVVRVSELFGLSPELLVFGSLRVTARKVFTGPVPSVPAITGAVRFFTTDGRQSASLPLFSLQRTIALYPHVAQNLGFYSGLAVVNPQTVDVAVTVEVFDEAGMLVGLAGFVLAPGARDSRLLNQLVPGSDGQLGGYFRVTATAGVISFALFGDLEGNLISVIPAQ